MYELCVVFCECCLVEVDFVVGVDYCELCEVVVGV